MSWSLSLFSGISPDDLKLFSIFKDRVEVVDIISGNASLIAKVAELRSHSSLKMPDAIVAATALVSNAVLITADQKLLRAPCFFGWCGFDFWSDDSFFCHCEERSDVAIF